jgi:hypothetical protein
MLEMHGVCFLVNMLSLETGLFDFDTLSICFSNLICL